MRIYTGTGDKGMTRLVGGAAVAKDSDRVESYGTIDELNSWIGYAATFMGKSYEDEYKEIVTIQNFLFDIGTELATPETNLRGPVISEEAISWIESRIDYYTDAAPDINRFILPGGCRLAALFHVARTIARRAERRIIRLNTTVMVSPVVITFVNRLSDYFYAIARYFNFREDVNDVFYERSAEVFHKIKEKGL